LTPSENFYGYTFAMEKRLGFLFAVFSLTSAFAEENSVGLLNSFWHGAMTGFSFNADGTVLKNDKEWTTKETEKEPKTFTYIKRHEEDDELKGIVRHVIRMEGSGRAAKNITYYGGSGARAWNAHFEKGKIRSMTLCSFTSACVTASHHICEGYRKLLKVKDYKSLYEQAESCRKFELPVGLYSWTSSESEEIRNNLEKIDELLGPIPAKELPLRTKANYSGSFRGISGDTNALTNIASIAKMCLEIPFVETKFSHGSTRYFWSDEEKSKSPQIPASEEHE
jgi:hypothetical protein